ncbi:MULTISPECIES: Wadjet anti-phage system protein JetD domain-containing protein [unclassified Pseudofrankia]|uniref:Wadjet anti-phage system protein JetD domain-containing protein n=1 Tax=unclassified Pseudofrankia TaxID=2994372 RepID=UPI000921D52F|nr:MULTISPECIES: DUF3322 and DUF2220 domain-containing protein [unclassified Pseudofrankia]MDT3442724.1 DUF2220 family protein [Pseudofrankia sp. BMG5.37]OHV44189.1 hypothetical protein BCD48_25755 [Pseudofrankia sp. BMG5.36]
MTRAGTNATGWTTLADVRARLRRRWENGQYLAAWAKGEPFEPVEVPLRGPAVSELADRFDEARTWSREWLTAAERSTDFRLPTRTVGGRSIGTNRIPARFVVDGGWDALWRLLQVTAEVQRFVRLRAITAAEGHVTARLPAATGTEPREADPPELDDVTRPGSLDATPPRFRGTAASGPGPGPADGSVTVATLVGWVNTHPVRVLQHSPEQWARILATTRWLVRERGQGRYLRQVPVPDVDTKFIEAHRALLAELLDLLLPDAAVDQAVSRSQFARRYGFRSPPAYARFRSLDPAANRLPGVGELSVRVEDLGAAAPDVGTVFVLENEITYLAFPDVPDAAAVFGGGYGLTGLAAHPWFAGRRVLYWGDLDTHGFAILDRLRAEIPDAESFLMDRATLLAHPDQWVREPSQHRTQLPRLTPEEAALHQDLVSHAYGDAIRLEQERISFPHVEATLTRLLVAPPAATAPRRAG